MRKLALLCSLLVAGIAVAGGITLAPSPTTNRFEFTDCSSGGSASQSVFRGTYLFRVTTEDVFICYAATCATLGEKFPSGTVMLISFNATTTVSCRSAASTGDAIFTPAG